LRSPPQGLGPQCADGQVDASAVDLAVGAMARSSCRASSRAGWAVVATPRVCVRPLLAPGARVEAPNAQESPVTAIDILLEPDATMVRSAQADNARLLKAYPDGFALDATHHPHITMLQQFVRTADLGKIYTAANRILANEKVRSWNLKAFKYY
jgi:hypothetical protein